MEKNHTWIIIRAALGMLDAGDLKTIGHVADTSLVATDTRFLISMEPTFRG